jgi:methylglutaconyl-CoA hydratase
MTTHATTLLRFLPLTTSHSVDEDFVVAELAINRSEAANAFNADVMRELIVHLDTVRQTLNCRALILTGRGKHFSAGADLAWMRAAAALSYDGNIKDSEQLIHLFEALINLPMPTIAVARGAVYGGAVGLVAACDYAIAVKDAKFCLSEVKLGLLPAVILPYLSRKMRPGQLRRHALSARIFSAEEALEFGLVELVAEASDLEAVLRTELNALLQGGPEAQAAFKILHQQVMADGARQGDHTAAAIAKARTSPSGQVGLASFFARNPSPWSRKLDASWSLNDP